MKSFNPYLLFDGNCSQAMKFYQTIFGGDLNMIPYAESPIAEFKTAKDRFMHASLNCGKVTLMAADNMPGHPYRLGNSVHVYLDCESIPELEKIFSKLSDNGNVTMPLENTFWGARFGTLSDQFKINWMLSCDLTKAI